MLRVQPTVISLTAGEVKDAETRRRFRSHLRKADVRQSQERKRMGLKHETPPTGRSSSPSTPRTKDEPQPPPGQRPDVVLTSSPPQPTVVPVQRIQEDAPQGLDTRESHGQSAEPVQEPYHTIPRLLEMTPRRLPSALLSASSLRRGIAQGRPGAGTAPSSPFLGPMAHRHDAVGLVADSEVACRSTGPVFHSPDGQNPTLPPPFSHTSRGADAESSVSRPNEVAVTSDTSDTEGQTPGTKASRKVPPAAPVRRSSLRATSYHPAVSDNQGDTSLPVATAGGATEASGAPTHSGGVESSARHLIDVVTSTPSTTNDNAEAETSNSSPSTRLGRLRIYNDSLPRSRQPETPQNLPEARHQSRLRGSYTVPARHGSPLRVQPPMTSRPWQASSGLNPSPAGLQMPGFLGLYGGIENGDEVELFQQAQTDLEPRLSRNSSSFGF